MFEKVNPSHPDKIADRIAGALLDLSYAKDKRPKVAVEVLIGHGKCTIINETSCHLYSSEVWDVVKRIAGNEVTVEYVEVPQDENLAKNQQEGYRCGDNGIFKGVPVTEEQKVLSQITRRLYDRFKSDGKYIIDLKSRTLIICQSNAINEEIIDCIKDYIEKYSLTTYINPLGYWTGGTNTDTGATNRKLGSDMGDSVTGGGLCGKDVSKADVSVNIYAWLKAQEDNKEHSMFCAIGDKQIDGIEYDEIVKIALDYINSIGGFEKFAEYGLI